MSAEIKQFPPPADKWVASFDLIQKPGGEMVLILTDCRKAVIEGEPTDPADKLDMLAEFAKVGAAAMKNSAKELRTP